MNCHITTGVIHDIHSFLLNSNQSDPEGVSLPKQKKVGLELYMYSVAIGSYTSFNFIIA